MLLDSVYVELGGREISVILVARQVTMVLTASPGELSFQPITDIYYKSCDHYFHPITDADASHVTQ